MATKRFFIRSSQDLITRELERLQTKVDFLEASSSQDDKKKRYKRTAVFSPPIEIEAKTVEFETDDEMFSV
jgi:hypothetical protein